MTEKIENPYTITWYHEATGSQVLAQSEYATKEECQAALNEIMNSNSYDFKEAVFSIDDRRFSFTLR